MIHEPDGDFLVRSVEALSSDLLTILQSKSSVHSPVPASKSNAALPVTHRPRLAAHWSRDVELRPLIGGHPQKHF